MSVFFEKKSGNTIDLIREMMGGYKTATGQTVNAKTALQVATVFGIMRVLGEGVAQVPLQLMRESPDGRKREKAKDDHRYDLMESQPNAWQTSFEYRETVVWHAALTGDHFSFKSKLGNKLLELIPIDPGRVTVHRAKNLILSYEIRSDDGEESKFFPPETIWHVKGPSWSSWEGLDSVQYAREAIGLSMAIEKSVGALHKNGVRPSGVYSVEGTLKDDQYKALAEWIEHQVSGVDRTGKPLILDRAAKWVSTAMTGIDAQSLENRRFQIEEACRFFRVNPIMVYAESKNTTYASAEQMFLSHVVHTLSPWFQRLEQSMNVNLLSKADRQKGLYFNFVEEGLLRGDAKTTSEVLLGYANGGLMTPNEARSKLDLNPMDDAESDELRKSPRIL